MTTISYKHDENVAAEDLSADEIAARVVADPDAPDLISIDNGKTWIQPDSNSHVNSKIDKLRELNINPPPAALNLSAPFTITGDFFIKATWKIKQTPPTYADATAAPAATAPATTTPAVDPNAPVKKVTVYLDQYVITRSADPQGSNAKTKSDNANSAYSLWFKGDVEAKVVEFRTKYMAENVMPTTKETDPAKIALDNLKIAKEYAQKVEDACKAERTKIHDELLAKATKNVEEARVNKTVDARLEKWKQNHPKASADKIAEKAELFHTDAYKAFLTKNGLVNYGINLSTASLAVSDSPADKLLTLDWGGLSTAFVNFRGLQVTAGFDGDHAAAPYALGFGGVWFTALENVERSLTWNTNWGLANTGKMALLSSAIDFAYADKLPKALSLGAEDNYFKVNIEARTFNNPLLYPADTTTHINPEAMLGVGQNDYSRHVYIDGSYTLTNGLGIGPLVYWDQSLSREGSKGVYATTNTAYALGATFKFGPASAQSFLTGHGGYGVSAAYTWGKQRVDSAVPEVAGSQSGGVGADGNATGNHYDFIETTTPTAASGPKGVPAGWSLGATGTFTIPKADITISAKVSKNPTYSRLKTVMDGDGVGEWTSLESATSTSQSVNTVEFGLKIVPNFKKAEK